MNPLGIYFGAKVISLVETKGRKVLNSIQIPPFSASPDELEEKVPQEVKIVALFKEELRRNKIEAKEANIALCGRDLIIRTFEIPAVLPRGELKSAVNFEVKKYIPFKIEDLISGFQLQFDKINRKNLVLFIGIKKETLKDYLTILEQLGIKIKTIEYSGFSILRFLKLAGLSDKGIVSLLSADLQEEGEISFVVLENGFPLFSHDISLTTRPEEPATQTENAIEPAMDLEKLKREICVALDYYHRRFPTGNMKKMFLISSKDSFLELEVFIKEMGLSVQFIDAMKYIDKPLPFSLSFIKGYSSSLSKMIKTNLKMNLLVASRSKLRPPQEAGVKPQAMALLADIKIEPKIMIVALFIWIVTFGLGFYQQIPLKKELKSIISRRPQVSTVNNSASYEELMTIDSKYKEKISTLDNLIKRQLYLSEVFGIIPQVIPKGVWLTNSDFKKEEGKAELTLRGNVYLGDSDQELQLINTFVANLKESPSFNKYFKNINVVSVDHSQIDKTSVTNFAILCWTK